jgi:hypothetical protein
MSLAIVLILQLLLTLTWVAFVQQILHLAQLRASFVGIASQITVLSEKAALAMEFLRYHSFHTQPLVQYNITW